MSLLKRIAYSDGDPQRTIMALRLLNERLEWEVKQYLADSNADPYCKGLLGRLYSSENRQRMAVHPLKR